MRKEPASQIILILILFLSQVPVLRSGQPLSVEDAEPLSKGTLEFEAGFEWCKYSRDRHLDSPISLAYGILNTLHFGEVPGIVPDKAR